MKLVIDNSVAMRWLFKDGSKADRAYAAHVASLVETCDICLPALFVAEAANVISRALRAGVVPHAQSLVYFELIDAMQATVVASPDTRDIRHIASLAVEDGLSAYDATYLRLAISLNCPLATLDQDLRKAAIKRGVQLVAAS